MKRRTFDTDDLIRRYSSGQSVAQIAAELHCKKSSISRELNAAGIQTDQRRHLPDAEVVSRYIGGESEKALADAFAVSRSVVRRVLVAAGIAPRNQSESMFLRMAQTPAEERERLTQAAHDAIRGTSIPFARLVKCAQTRQNRPGNISKTERQFMGMLAARGVTCIPQRAIGPYNCDLGASPVAVEIFGGQWHLYGRHIARTPERIRYILNAGWHLLAFFVSRDYPLTDWHADYAAAYIEQARRDPAARREYRVIRGEGKIIASGSSEDDDFTIIPAFTIGRDAATGRYLSVPR